MMFNLLVTYWPISLSACGVIIWLCLRGIENLGVQATIVQDMRALIERDHCVTVILTNAQIRYLRRWGFDVVLLEQTSGRSWWSEVTQ